MLPKKKKKPDKCKSNNIEGQNFSLGNNPSSMNQQSISNVVYQTNQNESSNSSPDPENGNEGENQMKNLFKHPMKTGLNQAEQRYFKYVKFRLSWRFHFHLHFIYLAKNVGCVSYAQNMEKGTIFGDLKE